MVESAVTLPYEGLRTDRWSHWELALDPDDTAKSWERPNPLHKAEAVYDPYNFYSLRKGLSSFARRHSYYIHAYPIAPGANATMVFLKGKSPNINGDMVVLCDIESQEMLRFVHVVLGARQSADEQRSALCAMQFSLTY